LPPCRGQAAARPAAIRSKEFTDVGKMAVRDAQLFDLPADWDDLSFGTPHWRRLKS